MAFFAIIYPFSGIFLLKKSFASFQKEIMYRPNRLLQSVKTYYGSGVSYIKKLRALFEVQLLDTHQI